MSLYLCSYITCCCTRTSVTFNETREVDDSFFVVCIKCDTSGNPILYVPSKASILIGDIWRERRNRSYPVFLSGCPPFEGILFRRGSTNITRAPRIGPLMDLLFASRRREYHRILFSSCNRVALRKSIPLSYRIVWASCLYPHFCDSSAESLHCATDRFRPDGAMADVYKDRRRMNWRDTSRSPSV